MRLVMITGVFSFSNRCRQSVAISSRVGDQQVGALRRGIHSRIDPFVYGNLISVCWSFIHSFPPVTCVGCRSLSLVQLLTCSSRKTLACLGAFRLLQYLFYIFSFYFYYGCDQASSTGLILRNLFTKIFSYPFVRLINDSRKWWPLKWWPRHLYLQKKDPTKHDFQSSYDYLFLFHIQLLFLLLFRLSILLSSFPSATLSFFDCNTSPSCCISWWCFFFSVVCECHLSWTAFNQWQYKQNVSGSGRDLGQAYVNFTRNSMDQIRSKVNDELWILNLFDVS